MHCDTYEYKVAEGCVLRVDVYRPGTSPAPAILYFHGGALIWGSRKDIFPSHVRRWTDAGYAVASVDYRLAPETPLEDIIGDARDALAWIRGPGAGRAGIDAGRVAVAGSSAGGYLALTLGLDTEFRPEAVVSMYGYGDILGSWYTSPSPWYTSQFAPVSGEEAWASVGRRPLAEGETTRFSFYLFCRQRGRWVQEVSGLDPGADAEAVTPHCPLRVLDETFPPTLLIHGDEDRDVPFEQSTALHRRLAERGVPVQLYRAPGGGHVFDADPGDPRTVSSQDQMVSFLNSILREE